MEIFRNDGGGHQKNPPRLLKVIGLVLQEIPDTNRVWKNIVSIEDFKGVLRITLDKEFVDNMDETFLYYLFIKAWAKIGESVDNVIILYKGGKHD
jgi:hypothetical protein